MDETAVGRREEVAANLAAARVAIDQACREAGRDPAEVALLAVTKNFPASDVCHLAALGVVEVGENRDQEAAAKAASVAESGVEVRWHFIGRLQSNKCRSVAGYADVVQSLDRVKLVSALDAACDARGRELSVLIQVSLDEDTSRGGVATAELETLAESILNSDHLRVDGVMAVAPIDWEPRRAFESLAHHAERLRKLAPQATVISAGMSTDFPEAIACGATMIRLGSKLLGPRRNVGYPVR